MSVAQLEAHHVTVTCNDVNYSNEAVSFDDLAMTIHHACSGLLNNEQVQGFVDCARGSLMHRDTFMEFYIDQGFSCAAVMTLHTKTLEAGLSCSLDVKGKIAEASFPGVHAVTHHSRKKRRGGVAGLLGQKKTQEWTENHPRGLSDQEIQLVQNSVRGKLQQQ
eukprot:TRINITY_DN1318_c0_g1_i1.p1 TRINITY_DN1318_c0_g1~~TRINITY_DN1318_c0_g1_i1.p1  ORF type:complete len:163 (-),score=34.03 TRINITY_DN1318_c0_g1_i1:72-560(-)